MIAVLGDIHGNLWALEAVLAELDRLGPSQVVVAGDLAFGGPRPAECVALIRHRAYPTIQGNTDEWLTAPPEQAHEAPPEQAHDTVAWTSAHLGEENRRFLAELPFLWRYAQGPGDLVVVHATPWSIGDVVRPDAPEALVRRVFDEAKAAAVVYGHIHTAYAREVGEHLLVNAGSVGMPFDGDPRAAYALLTSEQGRWTATLHRVAYDVGVAVRAARASDNPGIERWARRVETASARG